MQRLAYPCLSTSPPRTTVSPFALAVWRSGLPPTAQKIAIFYEQESWAGRVGYLTNAQLAQGCHVSTATITKYRKVLIAEGWLVELDAATAWRPARYLLAIPGEETP